MSWRVNVGFVVAGSVSALGAFSAPVQADEAYLCGPDNVVYVSAADLPMKKRTDPCIAAYYGLKVEVASDTPKGKTAVTPSTQATAAESVQAELRSLTDHEISEGAAATLERQASLAPPRPRPPAMPYAMPGTDYRNVKILNAATPSSAWFRHTK